MPIFEYRCGSCDQVFEKLQRRPSPAAECPRCGGSAPKTVSVFAAAGEAGSCPSPAGSGFR